MVWVVCVVGGCDVGCVVMFVCVEFDWLCEVWYLFV